MSIKTKYGTLFSSYYSEVHGNDRRIIGKLPEDLVNKVMMLPDDMRTQVLPLTTGINYKVRMTMFYYFFEEKKGQAFVRFDIHKFNDDPKAINAWIQIAAEHLALLKISK